MVWPGQPGGVLREKEKGVAGGVGGEEAHGPPSVRTWMLWSAGARWRVASGEWPGDGAREK